MIKFVRSIFGLSESADNRTVIGTAPDLDLKSVSYIKDSNARLTELSHLQTRYKGTPHELKIKAVYDKTKTIHTYLVSKKRVHELELFHLQNTEHFINTFSVIMDVHQKQQEDNWSQANRKVRVSGLPEKSQPIKNKQNQEAYNKIEMVMPVDFIGAGIPQLGVPEIYIDTSAKILYYKEDGSGNLISREIGYTAPEMEKESFLQYVSACLGIGGISYMGNALVTIQNNNGLQPTGLVPIIRWEGFLYALNLNDYRLFPVKINRKSI